MGLLCQSCQLHSALSEIVSLVNLPCHCPKLLVDKNYLSEQAQVWESKQTCKQTPSHHIAECSPARYQPVRDSNEGLLPDQIVDRQLNLLFVLFFSKLLH